MSFVYFRWLEIKFRWNNKVPFGYQRWSPTQKNILSRPRKNEELSQPHDIVSARQYFEKKYFTLILKCLPEYSQGKNREFHTKKSLQPKITKWFWNWQLSTGVFFPHTREDLFFEKKFSSKKKKKNWQRNETSEPEGKKKQCLIWNPGFF